MKEILSGSLTDLTLCKPDSSSFLKELLLIDFTLELSKVLIVLRNECGVSNNDWGRNVPHRHKAIGSGYEWNIIQRDKG